MQTKRPDVEGPPPVPQSHFVPEKCVEDWPLPRSVSPSACLTSDSTSECSLELASYSSPSQEELETTDMDTEADGARSSYEPSPATALHVVRMPLLFDVPAMPSQLLVPMMWSWECLLCLESAFKVG